MIHVALYLPILKDFEVSDFILKIKFVLENCFLLNPELTSCI